MHYQLILLPMHQQNLLLIMHQFSFAQSLVSKLIDGYNNSSHTKFVLNLHQILFCLLIPLSFKVNLLILKFKLTIFRSTFAVQEQQGSYPKSNYSTYPVSKMTLKYLNENIKFNRFLFETLIARVGTQEVQSFSFVAQFSLKINCPF